MEKDVYMTISSKTKQLLIRQEGFDVDFKFLLAMKSCIAQREAHIRSEGTAG